MKYRTVIYYTVSGFEALCEMHVETPYCAGVIHGAALLLKEIGRTIDPATINFLAVESKAS